MKTQEELDAALLEGMPRANKGRVVRKKRFVTSKHLPLDIAVRREVAEEIGEAEPTRDQKYILLQKYGVVAPRIDRLVTKPRWMGADEWKRKQNNWFKITHGSAVKYQQKSGRPAGAKTNAPQSKSWGEIRFKNSQAQQRHLARNSRPNKSNSFRQSSGPMKTGNTQS